MMRGVIYLILLVLFFSCERVVEIENPYPIQQSFCNVPDSMTGYWQSDSVWVVTEVDTLDSLIINTRPTFYYDLNVGCNDDTSFLLQYTNYSGVVTREVHSTNFEAMANAYFIYNQVEERTDTSDAEFKLKYLRTSDSTFIAHYDQELGSGQRSDYFIFFRSQE